MVTKSIHSKLLEPEKIITWLLFLLVTGLLAILVVFVTYVVTHWVYFGKSISSDTAIWGQFGDYVGGILNPILTFLTFMGLLLTIIMQRIELANSREELKLTRIELKRSAETQEARLKLAEVEAVKLEEQRKVEGLRELVKNADAILANALSQRWRLPKGRSFGKDDVEKTFEEMIFESHFIAVDEKFSLNALNAIITEEMKNVFMEHYDKNKYSSPDEYLTYAVTLTDIAKEQFPKTSANLEHCHGSFLRLRRELDKLATYLIELHGLNNVSQFLDSYVTKYETIAYILSTFGITSKQIQEAFQCIQKEE